MSDFRIIFPNDTGGIAIIVPAPGISQVRALEGVPAGKPYRIVDVADIPTDRTFRDAWTADFTDVSDAPTEVSADVPDASTEVSTEG